MPATTINRGRLRRLAGLRPENGRVLSVFIDLDPSEFATPPARATQINSLLDQAQQLVDGGDDLDHDEKTALREDIARVRELLDPAGLAAGGVRGLAVYACGPADLLEVVRLPHVVDSGVFIDDSPQIDVLATSGESEHWAVVLVSRSDGRIFLGDEHGLEEADRVKGDVKGQHQKGGWSQARWERSVEEEKRDHLDNLADELFRTLRRRPFDRLLVGGPEPLDTDFEGRLHPYVREKLVGRVQLDVENSSAADVLEAARPLFEDWARSHETEAIERLREHLNRPERRAVAGLPDVLAALNEQRVEVLLLEPRVSAAGWVDPETGFVAADPSAAPRGAGTLQEREDVIETALEKAVEQAAEVLVVRNHADLGAHGGIAALLRF